MPHPFGLFRLTFTKGSSNASLRFASFSDCQRMIRKLQRNGAPLVASVEMLNIGGWERI